MSNPKTDSEKLEEIYLLLKGDLHHPGLAQLVMKHEDDIEGKDRHPGLKERQDKMDRRMVWATGIIGGLIVASKIYDWVAPHLK